MWRILGVHVVFRASGGGPVFANRVERGELQITDYQLTANDEGGGSHEGTQIVCTVSIPDSPLHFLRLLV